jgi:hypothetical protein
MPRAGPTTPPPTFFYFTATVVNLEMCLSVPSASGADRRAGAPLGSQTVSHSEPWNRHKLHEMRADDLAISVYFIPVDCDEVVGHRLAAFFFFSFF